MNTSEDYGNVVGPAVGPEDVPNYKSKLEAHCGRVLKRVSKGCSEWNVNQPFRARHRLEITTINHIGTQPSSLSSSDIETST